LEVFGRATFFHGDRKVLASRDLNAVFELAESSHFVHKPGGVRAKPVLAFAYYLTISFTHHLIHPPDEPVGVFKTSAKASLPHVGFVEILRRFFNSRYCHFPVASLCPGGTCCSARAAPRTPLYVEKLLT
jgi:hypothetical protein